MASSAPRRPTSSTASAVLTYAPVILPRAGIALSATRRHALEMLPRAEQIELLGTRVPVPADALEDAGAVVHDVRADADLRIGEGEELSIQVGHALFRDLRRRRRPRGRTHRLRHGSIHPPLTKEASHSSGGLPDSPPVWCG